MPMQVKVAAIAFTLTGLEAEKYISEAAIAAFIQRINLDQVIFLNADLQRSTTLPRQTDDLSSGAFPMRKPIFSFLALVIFAAATFAQTSTTAPTLRIVTEDPNLPSDLFYGETKVKPVRLRPGTNTPITIDDSDFYVQQHYIDFLGRFPDAPGFAFWNSEITSCNGEARCIDSKRVNVSGSFFLSSEFQATGYYVYRLYKGAFGRLPRYGEFMPETRQLASGVVVDNKLSPEIIERNKQAFATAFVARGEFAAIYGGLSNDAYVDKLFQTTGFPPTASERTALINELNSTAGTLTERRVSVLRKIVDGATVIQQGVGVEQVFNTRYGKAFYDREYNPSFVLMEYFGYLRRDPDQAGYDFWLAKLNRFGNYIDAEMVRSFILATEYRNRF